VHRHRGSTVPWLTRVFRWQRMLDDGVCATIKELASRERANRRYMSRVLREKMRSGDDETEAGVGSTGLPNPHRI
jgi:hypothetical protein